MPSKNNHSHKDADGTDCLVCKNMIDVPVTVTCCKRNYCQSCLLKRIEINKPCPACRQPLNQNDTSNVNKELVEKLKELSPEARRNKLLEEFNKCPHLQTRMARINLRDQLMNIIDNDEIVGFDVREIVNSTNNKLKLGSFSTHFECPAYVKIASIRKLLTNKFNEDEKRTEILLYCNGKKLHDEMKLQTVARLIKQPITKKFRIEMLRCVPKSNKTSRKGTRSTKDLPTEPPVLEEEKMPELEPQYDPAKPTVKEEVSFGVPQAPRFTNRLPQQNPIKCTPSNVQPIGMARMNYEQQQQILLMHQQHLRNMQRKNLNSSMTTTAKQPNQASPNAAPRVPQTIPTPMSTMLPQTSTTTTTKMIVTKVPPSMIPSSIVKPSSHSMPGPSTKPSINTIRASTTQSGVPFNQMATNHALDFYFMKTLRNGSNPRYFLNDYFEAETLKKLKNISAEDAKKVRCREQFDQMGVIIPKIGPDLQVNLYKQLMEQFSNKFSAQKQNEKKRKSMDETPKNDRKKMRVSDVSAYVTSAPLKQPSPEGSPPPVLIAESPSLEEPRTADVAETNPSPASASQEASESNSSTSTRPTLMKMDQKSIPAATVNPFKMESKSLSPEIDKKPVLKTPDMIDALTLSRQSSKTLGKTLAESMRRGTLKSGSAPTPVSFQSANPSTVETKPIIFTN